MATTLFPDTPATSHLHSWNSGTTKVLSFLRGGGATTQTDATSASLATIPLSPGTAAWRELGPTSQSTWPSNGGGMGSAPASIRWQTDPLSAVTIAGTVTVNVRALESSAMANYGCVAIVGKVSTDGATGTVIGSGGNTTELGTSEAATSISITPTSTAVADGEMLFLVLGFAAAGGSSASGFTASVVYAGASGATGDTFVTFTETITAQGGAAHSLVASGSRDSRKGALPQRILRRPVSCYLNALRPEWRSRKSGLLVPAYS